MSTENFNYYKYFNTHHILIENVYTSSTKIKLFSIKWNVPFYIDNLTILCYVA